MKSKQLATALRKAISVVCDADNWITLKSGARVELNEKGEVQKGMGGKHTGQNVKEAAKEMSQESKAAKGAGAAGGGATSVAGHNPQRHGKETKTPSGISKSDLDQRDRNALGNAGKFTTRANAEAARNGQKYNTNIMQGESGQFWVPATNREESILKRLGYKEAK